MLGIIAGVRRIVHCLPATLIIARGDFGQVNRQVDPLGGDAKNLSKAALRLERDKRARALRPPRQFDCRNRRM